jgi:adenine-specific DNA-methyltransferase
MPTLSWLTRERDVKAADGVPYRLLERDASLSAGEGASGNMLIQGDNLEALKSLLPYYRGQVKCIYIDPPYNTRSAFEHYDDNLQHAEWLAMIWPRLVLLRELLSEDGSIWVSIDDNEGHYLKVIMDEVFGRSDFLSTMIWRKNYSPKSTARHFSEDHDYILVYAKTADAWLPNLMPRSEKQDKAYKNPDNDPRGDWKTSDLSARNYYSKGRYAITSPSGRVIDGPPGGNYWRVAEERFWELNEDNLPSDNYDERLSVN